MNFTASMHTCMRVGIVIIAKHVALIIPVLELWMFNCSYSWGKLEYPCINFYFSNSLFSTKYFQYHYITPHTRASTYIIGLVLGYVIHKTRNIKVEMSYLTVILGWILCVVVMLASLVGCHSFHAEESVYNRFESSIFLSFSRSAWTFGVVWVVWACIKGHGGKRITTLIVVNFVLSGV